MDDFVSFHSGICGDPNKLRYLCETFYRQYCDELRASKQELTTGNRANFLKNQKAKIQCHLIFQTENELNSTTELPFCGKYLLIAAYLASYNSQKTDKRFFSRLQGDKQSKRGKAASAFAKQDKQMAGPKKFTFERLYQLYHALIGLNGIKEEMDEMKTRSPTNQLFQQFQTFVSAKLILVADSAASFSPCSSSSKYCISDFITEQFIKKLAETLDLKLDEYLEKNLMKG